MLTTTDILITALPFEQSRGYRRIHATGYGDEQLWSFYYHRAPSISKLMDARFMIY